MLIILVNIRFRSLLLPVFLYYVFLNNTVKKYKYLQYDIIINMLSGKSMRQIVLIPAEKSAELG